MKRYRGTLANAQQLATALNTADGIPRRATVVGGPDMLPATYSVGAAGWIAALCAAPKLVNALYEVDVPDYGERYLTGVPAVTTRLALVVEVPVI